MSDPLKPRIDFTAQAENKQSEVLKCTQTFDQKHHTFIPQEVSYFSDEETDDERAVATALHPSRSLWRTFFTIGLVILGASAIAQGIQWILDAWQTRDWITLGVCVAGGVMVIAGVGALAGEWCRIRRLRARGLARDTAHELLHSQGMGKAHAFCENLARQSGLAQDHPALQRWSAASHESHSDRETVALYAQIVQPLLDHQARRLISNSAAESTLMIALSPLALVDMAFIAWRNVRLINCIAAIYGLKMGYFGRIRLFRLVLLNIAFTGAAELVQESGMDWFSQDLAARFSARAAQGIGAGLLTARLGIKTMELCRPLPWQNDDKPKLGDFRRELIDRLKVTLQPRQT